MDNDTRPGFGIADRDLFGAALLTARLYGNRGDLDALRETSTAAERRRALAGIIVRLLGRRARSNARTFLTLASEVERETVAVDTSVRPALTLSTTAAAIYLGFFACDADAGETWFEQAAGEDGDAQFVRRQELVLLEMAVTAAEFDAEEAGRSVPRIMRRLHGELRREWYAAAAEL